MKQLRDSIAGTDTFERVYRFAEAVRRAGINVTTDRVQSLLAVLAELGPERLYWAGRLTLCGSREDIARYDRVFAGETSEPDAEGRPVSRGAVAAPFTLDSRDGEQSQEDVLGPASAREVLRHRDIATMTEAERREVRRMLALLAPATPLRRVRRRSPAAKGAVDPRRTMRAMLSGLGEPARLRRRRRRSKPRRLVLLLDISGSMAPYAEALLRMAHAAVRLRPGSTEVFTIATRLTRITAALRMRDPQAALAQAGAEMPDWRGGTRLGGAFIKYLQEFGHRGMARGAVIVICSDGWETGDPAELKRALAWLARLAERVIWVTPHAGRAGFAPTVSGLAAALPHVSHIVAGHSIAALTELAGILSGRR